MSLTPGELTDAGDVEKQESVVEQGQHQKKYGRFVSLLKADDGEVYKSHSEKNPKWYQRILDFGVEENGIKPVPIEQRTEKRYWNLCTLMCSALLNLLPYVLSFLPFLLFLFSLRKPGGILADMC